MAVIDKFFSKGRILFYLLAIFIFFLIGISFSIFRWNILNPLKEHKLNINNLDRKFYFHVPKHLIHNSKLIFVLHGSTMTATQMQLVTGHQFDKIADEKEDSIIVYPQGYKKYWNDCRKSALTESKKSNLDEVLFFQEMISFFENNYQIDSSKVFITGFSNGGHMTFKLAMEHPSLFKGYAVISANLPVSINNDCSESKKPVSILVVNGTSDPVNPYSGGKVVVGDGIDRGEVLSTEETMKYWLHLTKCKLDGEDQLPDIEESDHSQAKLIRYNCPSSKVQLKQIKILNGGHNIPNPTFFLWPTKLLGNVNEDLNVPEIIMNFFYELN